MPCKLRVLTEHWNMDASWTIGGFRRLETGNFSLQASDFCECISLYQSKESDAARLAEELGASKARERELESRLNTEMQRLAEQIEDLEDRRKAEVDY